MSTATQLLKSRSVPGLMALGAGSIPLGKNHYRKERLHYLHDGIFEKTSTADVSSDVVATAQLLKNPSWRLMATEPRGPAEPDPVPRNMRWPRISPAWLKHEKHVLRFYAFFQESVVERGDENSRYRHVIIMYSMEDGTLQISEPRIENSGIPQGKFLRRHQVPKEDGTGAFIGPDDFMVGEDIVIYGRTYHITGCDRFTRWFFGENGIELPEDEAMPKDMFHRTFTFNKIAEKGGLPPTRSCMESKHVAMHQTGHHLADLKLQQFLKNDRKVLRFQAYWDDPTPFGNRFYFVVHYYLADNTVEINEAHSRNSGRDGWPVFYRRAPLQKENKINAAPGMLEPDPDIYEPKDFICGQAVNVWGRQVVLYECDDFTQRFYHEYLGYDQAQGFIDVSEPHAPPAPKLAPMPHNGVGTEEDSLINCVMIQPKPPRQDLGRLMTLSGECLRFECKLTNGVPEDENRKFVIGFFPADHTVACWESVTRNSGHMGGKFAEKGKKRNPDTGKYFALEDFRVGVTLTLQAHPFKLVRADEHALQYMEARPDECPFADPVHVARRLAPLQQDAAMHSEDGVDPDQLKEMATNRGVELEDHELITLLRAFCVNAAESVPLISGPRILECLGQRLQRSAGRAFDVTGVSGIQPDYA